MGIGSDLGLDSLGINVNGLSGLKGFVGNLIIFIVFAAILGIIVYITYNKKIYCEKIQIFEEINGQPVPTKQHLAREVNIPNTSIKVFQLKNKMYLPRPTIQTGKSNWIFWIRDDGEWMNVGMDNLNKTLTRLGFKYNHVDMRYANASLKELIKSNYGENDWLKKYGVYLALGILVVLMGVSFYLVAEKLAEASETIVKGLEQHDASILEQASKIQTSGIKAQ